MNVLIMDSRGDKLTRLLGKVLKLCMDEQHRRYGVQTFVTDLKDVLTFGLSDKVILTSYAPEYLSKIYSLPNADRVRYEGFFPEDVLLVAPPRMASSMVVHDAKMLFEPWTTTKNRSQADGALVRETCSWQYMPSEDDKSVLAQHGIPLP